MTAVTSQDAALTTILEYVARGWPVLPVWAVRKGVCACGRCSADSANRGKHPMTGHGSKDASTDPDVIRAWHAANPRCNWGIATGHPLPDGGRLVVLDIDPRKDGDVSLRALEAKHGKLPHTVMANTGGAGFHYLFRTSGRKQPGKVGEGIDFKDLGGYIVAEPSVHVSGGSYRWDPGHHPSTTAIAELPAWVLERAPAAPPVDANVFPITSTVGKFRRASLYVATMPGAVAGQGGHDTLFDVARTLVRGFDLDQKSAFDIIKNEYNARCEPPWSDNEIWHKVNSAHGSPGERGYLLQARKPAVSAPPAPPSAPGDSWESKLLYRQTRGGGPALEKVTENARVILKYDPRWAGKLRFDEVAGVIRCIEPPWVADDDAPTFHSDEWTDRDDVRAQCWLVRDTKYSLDLSVKHVTAAVTQVAHANGYNEIVDYLNSLTWDGVDRVSDFFSVYFGAESTEYTRAVGQRWLISAVARALEPGCQADSMVVLEGIQDAGKSTGIESLVGKKWFTDSHIPIGTADAYAMLQGKWVVEVAELSSFNRSDINKIKNFVGARRDHYRSSYGHRHETRERRCVFAGTTNESRYLEDQTGNRRFWPIRCVTVSRDAIVRDRDQIWAQASSLYHHGTPWHIDTPDLRALCAAEQEERRVVDPWEERIERWASVPDSDDGVRPEDFLTVCLNLEVGRLERAHLDRVTKVLRRLGYENRNVRTDGRVVRRWFRCSGRSRA